MTATYRVDDLKSVFNKDSGLAKSNRYRVIFDGVIDTPPPKETSNPFTTNNTVLNNVTNTFLSFIGIDQSRQVEGREMDILCDSVTWPGRQILTSDRQVSMRITKHAYAFAIEELSITFILTNSWRTWNFLQDWQASSISNIQNNIGYSVNFKDDYTKQITIEHLAEDNTTKKKVRIINAFPTTLNSLELGNGNESSILRCTATFSYDNWEIIN